tara:strand:- start:1688 stop:1972 length:285 start_codon:yes stop_codon:yes gene_type:complete
MQYLSFKSADFLERSNALRYLQGNPKCNPTRAIAYIEEHGEPQEEKLTWYSVDGPEEPGEKFFLDEEKARDYAKTVKEPQIIKFLGSTKDFILI